MNLFLIFQYGLVGAFVVLLATFVLVMVSDSVEDCVSPLFGLNVKNATLKFLGIGMGGVLVALQALMSYKRAKALEDTANAQAEAAKAQAIANQNTEQGQRQERLKNAIEHLGHGKNSVRLGGAYELFHLAEETKEWRQTILDILCAHIRQTTGKSKYRAEHKSKPSEEIQSLLTLLFVRDPEVFKGLRSNLQGSYLAGADLPKARLTNTDLTRASLQGIFLREAHLREAVLWGSYLQCAVLQGACLQGANLGRTHLQGVNLSEAQMQRSHLLNACLQGANLKGANLQGAACRNWSVPKSFEERIRGGICQKSSLGEAIFSGGLKDLDSLVKGLSDKKAEELREKMKPHIGKLESHELPENSRAITGAYGKEEAEQWIAEYNEAMSEVPGSDN